MKICCFIGHRKIVYSKELENKLKELITFLIKKGTTTFLFGSKSEFNTLCYNIVTKLKEIYPNIKRVAYKAKNESVCTSKEEAEKQSALIPQLLKQNICCHYYEEAIDCEKSCKANKKTFIARNQEIIDNSDICIFYYDTNYLPPKKKAKNVYIFDKQPKSGTQIAYNYATQKKKKIINLYE